MKLESRMIRMSQVQEISSLLIHEQIQAWEMQPVSQATDIELIDHLNSENYFDARYKTVREAIITSPWEEATVIGVFGRSSVGKGSIAMGIWNLLHQDMFLQQELEHIGLSLEVSSLPFAISQRASVLPQVRARYPVLDQYEMFDPEYYAGVSQFEWDIMQEHILVPTDGIKKALIVESPFSALPVSKIIPVQISGVDRGNSPVFNAAIDPRTSESTFIFGIDVGRDLHKNLTEQRSRSRDEDFDDEDVGMFFSGRTMYKFTNKDGERIDVQTLTHDVQRDIYMNLLQSMATQEMIERSNEQIKQLKTEQGNSVMNDGILIGRAGQRLGIENRTYIIKNKKTLDDNRTYDLDYLFRSLPAGLYPELLPKSLIADSSEIFPGELLFQNVPKTAN